MARMKEEELIDLGPWPKGANNIAAETSIKKNQFRSGVNVDTYPDGKVRRRGGMTRMTEVTTSAYSCWSENLYAKVGYYLYGRTLYAYTPGAAPVALYTGFVPNAQLTFCKVGQYIRVSDGYTAIRLSPWNNAVCSWGVPPMPANPLLSINTNGDLPIGNYQVAATYEDASGEEGGTSVANAIFLPAGGAITANLIQPTDNRVTTINVYITRQNGSELLLYGSYPVGTSSVALYNTTLGRPLQTQHFRPVLPGTMSAFAGGRLWVIQDHMLGWSQPQFYGQMHPAEDYLGLGGPGRLLAPSNLNAQMAGIFVATDTQTYFLAGSEPKEFELKDGIDCGVQPGSLVYVPGDYFEREGYPTTPVPVWIGTNGFAYAGLPSGQIDALTSGRFAMDIGSQAAAFYRELNGIRQAIFSITPPAAVSRAVAADSATVTVVRNGVVI